MRRARSVAKAASIAANAAARPLEWHLPLQMTQVLAETLPFDVVSVSAMFSYLPSFALLSLFLTPSESSASDRCLQHQHVLVQPLARPLYAR